MILRGHGCITDYDISLTFSRLHDDLCVPNASRLDSGSDEMNIPLVGQWGRKQFSGARVPLPRGFMVLQGGKSKSSEGNIA